MTTTVSETRTVARTKHRSPREAWAGIAFPVLFLASVVASNPPADNASDAKWTANYTGTGHRVGHLATGILLLLAGLCLAGFLAALWQRIHDARPTISPLPLVMAGVAGASIAAGGVVMAFISASELTGKYPLPGPQLLRLGNDLGFGLAGVAGMLAASVTVAVLSSQAHTAGILGRNMYTFGIVVAIVLLASVVFIPIIALLIWSVLIAVQWLRSPSPAG